MANTSEAVRLKPRICGWRRLTAFCKYFWIQISDWFAPKFPEDKLVSTDGKNIMLRTNRKVGVETSIIWSTCVVEPGTLDHNYLVVLGLIHGNTEEAGSKVDCRSLYPLQD